MSCGGPNRSRRRPFGFPRRRTRGRAIREPAASCEDWSERAAPRGKLKKIAELEVSVEEGVALVAIELLEAARVGAALHDGEEFILPLELMTAIQHAALHTPLGSIAQHAKDIARGLDRLFIDVVYSPEWVVSRQPTLFLPGGFSSHFSACSRRAPGDLNGDRADRRRDAAIVSDGEGRGLEPGERPLGRCRPNRRPCGLAVNTALWLPSCLAA